MARLLLNIVLEWAISKVQDTIVLLYCRVGLGGLRVPCLPRDPKFAGSNMAEFDGFFQDVKILITSPPGGTLRWGSRFWDFRLVKEPQA